MADPSLNTPVTVTSTRIDATLLPSIFSLPYQLYVIQNGTDFGNVAGKANEAGAGAFDAQVRNDEQDIILDNHETRIA
ncbi:TPA: phage tail protein, partial [Yersinia enterocolitica]